MVEDDEDGNDDDDEEEDDDNGNDEKEEEDDDDAPRRLDLLSGSGMTVGLSLTSITSPISSLPANLCSCGVCEKDN